MELTLGALGGLAPKLAYLLKDEYVKQKGLKPDIKSLSGDLLMMHAALADVSRVPRKNLPEVDKVWARLVRELAYDTEDAIDTFVVRLARREPAVLDLNVFKKISRKAAGIVKNLKGGHKLADRVKDIKNLSKELVDLCAKYRFSDTIANPITITGMDPRLLNMYKSEAELVGIEEPRDELIRRLTDGGSEQSLKIVSIVGFGGLGKTALAKSVYDRLKKQFDCIAFVSVGKHPRITSVLESLLKQLDEKKYILMNMTRWYYEDFSDELHKLLRDKRFFIVIDDIWEIESWKIILYSLSLKDSHCGSRIIMTTRNYEVVTKEEDVYKLKPLSHHNSKILFNKRILSEEGECLVNQPDELSDKILRKSGGVPLAIIAIASLLADRPWQEWSEVYNSIFSGCGDSTMEIISYSYEDLPSHLKPCLLYMSTFPEDYVVVKNVLIWMWIAEGFVQIEKEEDNIFDQGERYFNKLINRGMIQPVEDRISCSIYACRVHNIVYDLICSLSREENFATCWDREQYTACKSVRKMQEMDLQRSSAKVRRLALHVCHLESIFQGTHNMLEAVRSLIVKRCVVDAVLPFDRFQVCRLICIEQSCIRSFKHLGKLLHLRYLAICWTHVEKLPEEIVDMKSLQSLVLIDIGPHELPPGVCALTTLMFMNIIGFKRLPANRMGNLVYLEELCLDPIVGRSETDDLVVQLGSLTRLKVLHIKFAEQVEESSQNALVNSLYSLHKIQDLKVMCPQLMKASDAWQCWDPPRHLWRLLIPCINFSRLPAWISSSRIPFLSNLDVCARVVQEQDLENLARLPELCYLSLQGLCIHQGYIVCSTGRFNKLRVCNVATAFTFQQGAMPSLEALSLKVVVVGRHLKVDGVEHEILRTKDVIGDLDLGLENLLSLEQVTITVDCEFACRSDVEDAEAVARCAVKNCPMHPTFFMERVFEELMMSDEHVHSRPEPNTNILYTPPEKDGREADGSSSLAEVKDLRHQAKADTTERPDERHSWEMKLGSDHPGRDSREGHDMTIMVSESSNMQDGDVMWVLDCGVLRTSQPQPTLMDIYQDSRCLALEKALDDERVDPVDLPFLFFKFITQDFSVDQRIGSGGFGTVYKGLLPSGMVAVKKLHNKIEILEENFRSEVACLMEVRHENIVRFLGYCSETQRVLVQHNGRYILADMHQRLFCFEYLGKGSLAKYLTEASTGLQWRVRYQIIKGICKGLGYLHRHKIIHMDLKPENILLDHSMVPKIADFGLSRRFNENQSRAITQNIVGTKGYMAPEFIVDGIITLKTDIYSLGVIIIYILMGCKECPNVQKVLERWMIMFGTLENHALLEQVKICAEIGINCKDHNPSNRPAIHDIIRKLDEMDISNSFLLQDAREFMADGY